MVRNGSNVQLVTESEGIVSCVRHYIIFYYSSGNLLIVGRVSDVVILSICFLQKACRWDLFTLECWRINQTKSPEKTAVSSVATVRKT
jgi:hypothetical protein